MIALDTNVLVYAQRRETEHHAAARKLVTGLAEADEPWGLPWPCVYEFLRVVTHPRVFDPPTRLATPLAGVESLLDCSAGGVRARRGRGTGCAPVARGTATRDVRWRPGCCEPS